MTGTPVRSAAGAFNDTKVGGGGGASARLPLLNKKLDFVAKGVFGDGIGRYGSAQLADETFHPDGTAALIRTTGATPLRSTVKVAWIEPRASRSAARARTGAWKPPTCHGS